MAHSVVTNFMSSPDFNCRQIWLSRSELCSIDMYGKVSLADLPYLKQHPKVHLSDDDMTLLDDYFQLLCRRMRDQSPSLYFEIVRSLVSTMILEMLCMMRRQEPENARTGNFYRQRLADKFMRLVEESDGRIRRVDDFANQLNITPKYLSTLLKETMSRRPQGHRAPSALHRYDDAGDCQRPELPQCVVLWQVRERTLRYDAIGVSEQVPQVREKGKSEQ